MRAALIQLNSSDDPARNLPITQDHVARAAANGAVFILTPEVTNCVSASRTRQSEVLQPQEEDMTLGALRQQAADLNIWLLIGSLALKTDDRDGRFANRSFLIGPDGAIAAWYDKIHMFDVQVSAKETYRESAGYRPGTRSVLARPDFGNVGLTVCYDVRFPHLYRQLAQAGAQILTVPSAFSPVTGAVHWNVLLRARAIETGCYVLAPAQTGMHHAVRGKQRETYGHSMAISPWGDVLADAGADRGIIYVDLDLSEVPKARQRIPSLIATPDYGSPK